VIATVQTLVAKLLNIMNLGMYRASRTTKCLLNQVKHDTLNARRTAVQKQAVLKYHVRVLLLLNLVFQKLKLAKVIMLKLIGKVIIIYRRRRTVSASVTTLVTKLLIIMNLGMYRASITTKCLLNQVKHDTLNARRTAV